MKLCSCVNGVDITIDAMSSFADISGPVTVLAVSEESDDDMLSVERSAETEHAKMVRRYGRKSPRGTGDRAIKHEPDAIKKNTDKHSTGGGVQGDFTDALTSALEGAMEKKPLLKSTRYVEATWKQFSIEILSFSISPSQQRNT